MDSAIDTALSGLNAASKRLQVSANNIANQFSTQTNTNGQVTNTAYTPQRVDQVSLSAGGVQSLTSNVNPATTTSVDSQGNSTQQPNVDPANELVQQNIASYDFQANLKTIQSQNDIYQSLLNIVS